VRSFSVVAAKANNHSYKLLIWELRLLAGRRQPKAAAKPNTHCISKKAAALGGRQVRLCPSKAERCSGDVGAPTGAVD